MIINVVYIYLLSIEAHANIVNDLIVDYFYSKNVPNVIGYSCNNEDDGKLLNE